MKTFNQTIAIRVLFIAVAIDAMLMVLDFLTTDSAWTSIPFWIVNLPGMALLYAFLPQFPVGSQGILSTLIFSGLLSALLWSAIAAFLFRHRHVA
jgi:hypothetical protein